jgi:type IV pilus assembly protein PilV
MLKVLNNVPGETSCYRTGRLEQGFTLIEVMISFLILAIGLLGMGSMVATGTQLNQNAHLRTASVVLAQDMADRVRANRQVDYATIETPEIASDCFASESDTLSACATMAETDIAVWNASVAQLLPGGQGVICGDDTPSDGDSPDAPACDGGDATAIKIWWVETSRTEESDGGSESLVWQRHVSVLY